MKMKKVVVRDRKFFYGFITSVVFTAALAVGYLPVIIGYVFPEDEPEVVATSQPVVAIEKDRGEIEIVEHGPEVYYPVTDMMTEPEWPDEPEQNIAVATSGGAPISTGNIFYDGLYAFAALFTALSSLLTALRAFTTSD